MIRFDISPLKS